MRLVSWNVNRAVAKLDDQAAAVATLDPDVVALQEVTATTAPRWCEALAPRLPHIATTLDDAPAAREPAGPRRLFPLVASRWPLAPCEPPALPWPETVVAVRVATPRCAFELFDAHVPNSRNGWIKVETLEGLHSRLDRDEDLPRVVCGDFNTPRSERADGSVVTFARDRHARLRPERGERWDRAELSLLRGLEHRGMADVFRHLHGPERREISWNWPLFPRSGYRLDHVIASLALRPTLCEYAHEVRTQRLSDHSALVAEFSAA